MESAFAVVDAFFVARLGADAVATVGLTESMLSLIYSVAMGLGIGATAMVARRIGEKDEDGAARAAVQSITLGVLVSVPIGAVGIAFAPELLGLLGAADVVRREHAGYTRVMLGGNLVILLLFMVNARSGRASARTVAALFRPVGLLPIVAPADRLGRGHDRAALRRDRRTRGLMTCAALDERPACPHYVTNGLHVTRLQTGLSRHR